TFRDLASGTLKTIQQEELLRQSTGELGIQVTDDDIDNGIKNAAGLLTGAPQDAFAPAYRSLLLQTGLSNTEYRDVMKAQVIQQKFTEKTVTSIPDQGPSVKIHLIVLGNQSK